MADTIQLSYDIKRGEYSCRIGGVSYRLPYKGLPFMVVDGSAPREKVEKYLGLIHG